MKFIIFLLFKGIFIKRVFLALFLFSLLSCSTSFLKKDKSKEPLPLVDFNPKVELIKEWSRDIKHGQGKDQNKFELGFDKDNVYVASINGLIEKYDLTGKLIWSKKISKLSTGIGVGENGLAVVSNDGYLIFFEKNNGREIWRENLYAEVLAPPQISKGILVLQTFDGRLIGFNASNGVKLWVHTVDVPILTLRGTATPVIENKHVYSAFSDGKLKKLDLESGNLLWEQTVSISRGESDIQRIVDIDGSPLVSSNRVFASSYNGNLAAFNKSNGRPLWREKNSSYQGLAQGFRSIYTVDDKSTVLAFDSDSGDVRWKQEAFLYRELGTPVIYSGYLLVLDSYGFLHVLSQLDGDFIGREKVANIGSRAPMVVKNEKLHIYLDNGKLIVYDLKHVIPRK